jgi:futalosine hydrolase
MQGAVKIIVTFPTEGESRPFLERLGWELNQRKGTVFLVNTSVHISIAITGVGMVSTAFQLGRLLSSDAWDWAIQAGIAGTFDSQIALGSVGQIADECFPELGAEWEEGVLDMEKLGFATLEIGGKKYFNQFHNPYPRVSGYPVWTGITVNTVSGTSETIQQLQQKWSPTVESMETAAFFHSCLAAGVPFLAMRAVSNRVEPRNTANWQIKLAIEALADGLMDAISQLTNEN